MAQNMNIDQFGQLLMSLCSVVNQERTQAEQAVQALETNNPDLYVSLLLEAMAGNEGMIFTLAGLLLKNLLRKDTVPHSLYDFIYEKSVYFIKDNNTLNQRRISIANLLCLTMKNQLTQNNGTIFNKFMNIFNSETPEVIKQALLATQYLFEEEDTILQTHYDENSARLQLLFDKLIHFLKLDRPEYARELYRALEQAVRTSEYLKDESVSLFVMQKLIELIATGVPFGYQVLRSGLSHLYGLLERCASILVNSISKVNDLPNLVDDIDFGARWRTIIEFWLDFCDLEKDLQIEYEEFAALDMVAPEGHYFGLLQQYGGQVIDQLISLVDRMEIPSDDEFYGPYLQCIMHISNEFNIDISHYLDRISDSRTTLLLDTTTHLTHAFTMLQMDSLGQEKRLGFRLRFSPAYLIGAIERDWATQQMRQIEIKDMFVAGAAEYIPMYDKTVQEKCIKFACEPVAHPEDARLGSFAEMIRLPLVKKEYSDFVIKSLRHQQLGIEEQIDNELKCYQNIAQLYNVPDEALQQFIRNCLGHENREALYHLIKPLQSLADLDEEIQEIFSETIMRELDHGEAHDETLSFLSLFCQKLSSSIPSKMYSEILSRLGSLQYRSYRLFNILANVSPPAGVSHLSHLETIVDLFEKKVQSHVTDDVYIEQAIRGLTAVLHSLKKSSNEFLFVRHIKTIVSALQPALDEHSDPSNETVRAYLILIKELCTLFQAAVILRSTAVSSVLCRACESRDRTVKSLAQTVTRLLDDVMTN